MSHSSPSVFQDIIQWHTWSNMENITLHCRCSWKISLLHSNRKKDLHLCHKYIKTSSVHFLSQQALYKGPNDKISLLFGQKWEGWSELQYPHQLLNTHFCWPDSDNEEKKWEKRKGGRRGDKMKGKKKTDKIIVLYQLEIYTFQRLIIQCGLCVMICVHKAYS